MAKGDKPNRGIIKSGNSGNSNKSNRQISSDVKGGLPLQKTQTAKSIVASSSSWTGKLPGTLLHEHCQKLKWEKINYDMKHTVGGFTATAILGQKNNKTSQVEYVRFTPPEHLVGPQPTALEARHFAATFTLHRIASQKNMSMILPGEHKTLWRKLDDQKRVDIKEGNADDYSTDPFIVQRERNAAKAAVLQKKKEKQEEKIAIKEGLAPVKRREVVSMKGWDTIPVVDMSKEMRSLVDSCIRKYHVWDMQKKPLENKRDFPVKELVDLGFRESHVLEAFEFVDTKHAALEWLLLNVPEDDLPLRFLPENYSPGATIATGSLQTQYAIKRLGQIGFPLEIAQIALEDSRDDECQAAYRLMFYLMNPDSDYVVPQGEYNEQSWREESEVLQSIYRERYSNPLSHIIEIKLDLIENENYNRSNLSLRFYKTVNYPETAVLSMGLFATENNRVRNLPSYIRLGVLNKAYKYASKNLLGEPMIFSIVEWIQENLENIISHPVRLSSLSGAIYGISSSEGKDTISSLLANLKLKKSARDYRSLNRVGRPKVTSEQLLADLREKQTDPKMDAMYRSRKGLPAWHKRDEIVATVKKNQVTIITGETGSGKSTQSIQFILDDMIMSSNGSNANIICTQPRRISAMGLAARVSDERGYEIGQQVGYSIRGESKVSEITQIRFTTTGVVLRMLQMDMERALKNISHIVIDEVHERSLDSDFLLIILRRLIMINKKIKIILMSATVNAKMFADYFGSAGHVIIEGRTFPVEDIYIDKIMEITGFRSNMSKMINDDESKKDEDSESPERAKIGRAILALSGEINYDLISIVVNHIDRQLGGKEGSILIFLPGTAEISRAISSITKSNFYCLPLHASLLPAEQRRVFFSAPKGKRKVVVATNVAETSITIPDVVAVIDSGRVKETVYDAQLNMTKLEDTWVSQAAAKQRRGRAGRVASGTCYKLYTRDAESTKMPERQKPEMVRTPLQQLYLMVKAMHVKDTEKFLSEALDPPNTMAIETARNVLIQVGVLHEETTELTALGTHLASIPADIRSAKLLIYGAIFNYVEVTSVIAAILTVRSPFMSSSENRDAAKKARLAFSENQGDILADARSFLEWEMKIGTMPYRSVRQWCDENFLSMKVLEDISSSRDQYLTSLQEIGFISSTKITKGRKYDTRDYCCIRTLVAAAMNPSFARIQYPEKKYIAVKSGAVELDPEAKSIKLYTRDNGRVFIHPSSTLFSAQSFIGGSDFMAYFQSMATSKIFIRELTPLGRYGLLLFGGSLTTDLLGRGVTLQGWIRLRSWARIGVLVNRLKLLLDQLLALKIEAPEIDVSQHEVVQIVKRLIEKEGL
ncbi:P-loop containing nucleoside triphosphate hydrolase protein [Dipodascopsis uninucleata]